MLCRLTVLLSALRLVLVGLIAVLMFAFYVQTRHGFRHVILPLMSGTVPETFTIRDGALRLRGSLELDGFRYGNAITGVSVEAERVFVRLSLLSLVRDRIPLIHELQIQRATISLSPPQVKSVESGKMIPPPRGSDSMIVPVVIERGHVEDMRIVIRDDQRTITAEAVTLELNQLGPACHGNLSMRANLRLDQQAEEIPWFASITLNAGLDVNEAGTEAKWTGSNALRIRERREGLAGPASEVILVEQTLAGEYDHEEGTLQASSRFTASKDDVSLGSAAVTMAMTHSESTRTVDASLTIQDVSGEALTAWLGSSSPARSYSALINGQVFLHGVGPLYEVQSTLVGQRLQLRSEAGTTPPLDLSLKQASSFDAQSHVLLIEGFDLAVSRGTRCLLNGKLHRPLKLLLKHDQVAEAVTSGGAREGADLTLRVQDLELADLRPWMALFGHETRDDVSADPLSGTLNVSADESGATVFLDGHLLVTNATMEDASEASLVGPLSFEQRVRARLVNLTRLEIAPWTSIVMLKGRTVGKLRATGSFPGTAPAGPLALEGSLTLSELPGGALNPAIVFWKPLRVQGGRFSGHATWKLADGLIGWEADLRGRQIRLQPPSFLKATPPLDLAVVQSGTYDQTTGELRLVKSNAQAADKGRVVVSAALSHPVSLHLFHRKTQASPPPVGIKPVTFTMEIDGLDLEQLKVRLSAMGINAMETVQAGVLNGRLKARWHGTGDKTAVTGNLTASGLRFQRGAAQSVGPVSITARGNVTIEPDARLELTDCRLALSSANRAMAAVTITGATAIADGATDLTIDARSRNLATLLDRLAMIGEPQRPLFAGGLLKLEGKVTGSGRGQPLSIQTSIQAKNLRIGAGKTGSAAYSIVAHGDLEIDSSRTVVKITQLGMVLESDGRRSGSASVTGRWPLTSAGQQPEATPLPTGAMKVIVKDWDGRPFADLYNFLPGRMKGPFLVNTDMVLEQDQTGGVLTVRGRTTAAPIRVVRKSGGVEEATLHLEHDVTFGHEGIRTTSMTFTSERPHGSADRVTLSGVVHRGNQPRTELRSEIASLDAGWYEDLLAVPGNHKDRPGPPAVAEDARPEDRDGPQGFRAPRDLQAEVTFGTLLYRGISIGPGRLIAERTGNRFTATVEPTVIARGKVQGELVIVARDREPEYSWTSKGDGLDVGILSGANHPGSEPPVAGVASFTTSGTARGKGQNLEQTVSGTAVWDVVKGKFSKASLLAFISKHTGIKGLEGMTFDRMHGELRLGQGWIHVNRVEVDGSSAKLEGQGKIRWDGLIEGHVATKITPALADKVRIRCVTGLLKGTDGLLALPVVVAIKGTVDAPEFGVELTGEKAKSAAGSLTDLLRGCREDSSQPKTTPDATGR